MVLGKRGEVMFSFLQIAANCLTVVWTVAAIVYWAVGEPDLLGKYYLRSLGLAVICNGLHLSRAHHVRPPLVVPCLLHRY